MRVESSITSQLCLLENAILFSQLFRLAPTKSKPLNPLVGITVERFRVALREIIKSFAAAKIETWSDRNVSTKYSALAFIFLESELRKIYSSPQERRDSFSQGDFPRRRLLVSRRRCTVPSFSPINTVETSKLRWSEPDSRS